MYSELGLEIDKAFLHTEKEGGCGLHWGPYLFPLGTVSGHISPIQ